MTPLSWGMMLAAWAVIIAVNLFCVASIIAKKRRNGGS